MKRILLFLLFLNVLPSFAQPKVFTEDELVAVILKFHPVARQASLDVEMARAGILSSRAGFDPVVSSERSRKELGGLNYYDHQVNEVKIPTWYGMDLYAGNERITGDRLNPEATPGSITYLGFSLQPLQNLLMDKRRATLLQAKNFYSLSEVQRKLVVNDLLQEALYFYWDWWEKYQVQRLVNETLFNAERRLQWVKAAFQMGERPAIDTIEAYTQVQAFQIQLSGASRDLMRSHLQLSAFLWTERNGQKELPVDAIPGPYKADTSLELPEILLQVNAHPGIRQYDYKLKELQIDKRLAFQSLLPNVQLKYNQTGYNLSKTVNAPWFNNNYRFGMNISVPLRFSQGRGDYREVKLKIQSTQLEQALKQVEFYTQVKQYFTDWQLTKAQVTLQDKLLSNIKTLQRGEEIKWNNGESSLFMLNAREQKTIEAEQKLVELQAKAQKAMVGVRWSAGILGW